MIPVLTQVNLELLQKRNNFPGLERLVKLAKETHPEITRPQVKQFLEQDATAQLTKVQHVKPSNGHIVAIIPNELWQLDIFDLSRYMYSNKYYRYVLCAIDVFTRQAHAEPLLTKDSAAVAKAFKKMIVDVKPRSMLADQDTSFQHEPFQDLLKKENIILNTNANNDHKSLGIIDNFARRLKLILTKTFLKTKKTVWIDKLADIIKIYNNTKHASLNDVKPNDALSHREEILNINLDKSQANHTTSSDLREGDKVRKTLLKQNHGIIKGTDPRWSNEVFTVTEVRGQTITLSDGSRMKRTDLLKVPNDAHSSTSKDVITEERKTYKKYKNQ
jgi:hypothetical protein